MPDCVEACKGADILIFVMPHQFVRGTCKLIQEHVKDTALAVSLIKVSAHIAFINQVYTVTYFCLCKRLGVD
jgi:glycerol-3-phosphate dehydrogenase